MDPTSARYSPEMTPLMLAAQKNNYEILKLLLDRGATLPMPHDVCCSCDECLRMTKGKGLFKNYVTWPGGGGNVTSHSNLKYILINVMFEV